MDAPRVPASLRLQRKYEEHSYLWRTDLDQYFKDFCEDAVIVTPLGQRIVDLAKFDQVPPPPRTQQGGRQTRTGGQAGREGTAS